MIENRIKISEIISVRRMDPSFFRTRGTLKGLVSLSTYVNVKGGKRIPKGDSFTEGDTDYLYLRISDIDDFENIDYSSFKNISTELFKKLERYEIHENKIAFSIAGTIGRVFIVKDIPSDKRIILTENCAKLSLKSQDVLPDFLKIVLDLPLIQQQINSNRIQTTIPKIGLDRIGKLQIPPVPPMDVQQRIVDIYSKASEQKRSKEQEAQTLLDSIDSYLLGELGITLPETPQRQLAFKVNISEMLGNMFDCRTYNAKTLALKEMINHYTGHKLKLRKLVLQSIAGDWGVDETEVPENKADEYTKCLVIRATEFDNKDNLNLDNSRVKFRMIRNDKLNKMDLRSNDIFIEKSGGSPDQPVGRVAILTSEIEQNNVLCYSNFIHKIRIDSSKVLPQYLFYYLRTLYNVKVTESMQSQTNGIRNLIMGSFLGQHIILPPPAKQNEIAETISKIRAKASVHQAEATDQFATAKAKIEKIILG